MTSVPADRRWWKIALYPLVVPVAFIILIWSATDIHPLWLLRPLAVTAGVVLLMTVAFSALLQDRDRGALAASAVVVALVVNDFRLAALLAVIAWLIVAEGVMNWRRPWRRGPVVTRGLTVTCMALLAVTLIGAIQSGSIGQAIDDLAADLAEPPVAQTFDPNAPDIYVVLLDGYPGDDAMELDPSFDADAFANALTARAFDVQRHTRSNYLLTRLTLATMFGGDHIASSEDLRPPFLSNADDARRLRRFGDDGPIYRALRDAGYETATIASDASHLGLHRVDRVVEAPGINEFEGVLLRASTAGMLLERYFQSQLLDMRRANVLKAFAAAETSGPSGDRPLFEWVHLMAPHPPLAFDADGRPVDDVPALSWQEPTAGVAGRATRIRRTFEYVKFVDTRTLALVDRLVERDPLAVIVVMSDHGTDTAFNAQDPLGSDLNERTSALLAVRSPGHRGLLPPGTTPINVLPRVLNAYLGTSLPIRSETTWAWPAGGSVLDAIPLDMKAIAR
jgi:hypothetical protein